MSESGTDFVDEPAMDTSSAAPEDARLAARRQQMMELESATVRSVVTADPVLSVVASSDEIFARESLLQQQKLMEATQKRMDLELNVRRLQESSRVQVAKAIAAMTDESRSSPPPRVRSPVKVQEARDAVRVRALTPTQRASLMIHMENTQAKHRAEVEAADLATSLAHSPKAKPKVSSLKKTVSVKTDDKEAKIASFSINIGEPEGSAKKKGGKSVRVAPAAVLTPAQRMIQKTKVRAGTPKTTASFHLPLDKIERDGSPVNTSDEQVPLPETYPSLRVASPSRIPIYTRPKTPTSATTTPPPKTISASSTGSKERLTTPRGSAISPRPSSVISPRGARQPVTTPRSNVISPPRSAIASPSRAIVSPRNRKPSIGAVTTPVQIKPVVPEPVVTPQPVPVVSPVSPVGSASLDLPVPSGATIARNRFMSAEPKRALGSPSTTTAPRAFSPPSRIVERAEKAMAPRVRPGSIRMAKPVKMASSDALDISSVSVSVPKTTLSLADIATDSNPITSESRPAVSESPVSTPKLPAKKQSAVALSRPGSRKGFTPTEKKVSEHQVTTGMIRSNAPVRQWDSAASEEAPALPLEIPPVIPRHFVSLSSLAVSLNDHPIENPEKSQQELMADLEDHLRSEQAEQAVKTVQAGANLEKHIKQGKGKPHTRYFRVFETGIVGWAAAPKDKLRAARIESVALGPSVGVAQHRPPTPAEAERTFTFQTKEEGAVCVIARSKSEAAQWVEGVSIVLQRLHNADQLIARVESQQLPSSSTNEVAVEEQ